MPPHPHDQSRQTWDASREDWQDILNERPIPPRRAQVDHEATVRVRVVWERDGEEWIDTRALAYTRDPDAVLVTVSDQRRPHGVHGVWLPPQDVQRR